MPDPTLIIVWTFTWIAVTVMCLRLLLVRINKKPFSAGDYLTMGAIFCAIARLSLIHVVLIWGSNNVSHRFRATHVFTQQQIYQREIGGKLTIVNRLFYNS
jgi:FtsH-binding integral membrane protein